MTEIEENQPGTITTPPNNPEAEEALLASCLIDPEQIRDIDLDPADFYTHKNRWIWEAFQALARSGRQVDAITLADQLEGSGHLAQIGGPAYLTELLAFSGYSWNAIQYADMIREAATRRRMIATASLLARNAYDRTVPVETTISDIAVRLPALCAVKTGARHIGEYASRHYDRIDAARRGEMQSRIIPTGFQAFDEATGGGLREKELMWLIGLPGLGKTKWALQAAFQMGFRGTGVAVYSWETGEEDILDREVSRETRIPQTRLEHGDIKDGEWPVYTQAIEKLTSPDLPIYVEFCGGMNATALRADLSQLKAEHGIQVFVIDYLKFFHDRLRGESETDRQNRLSGALKVICRELSMAGIVIDVFNKEGMAAALPKLENQTQGADKSYDADKVLFMVNHIPRKGEGEKQDNVRTFIFGKSRRKLTKSYFHLVAGADFPDFYPLETHNYNAQIVTTPAPRRAHVDVLAGDDDLEF